MQITLLALAPKLLELSSGTEKMITLTVGNLFSDF